MEESGHAIFIVGYQSFDQGSQLRIASA